MGGGKRGDVVWLSGLIYNLPQYIFNTSSIVRLMLLMHSQSLTTEKIDDALIDYSEKLGKKFDANRTALFRLLTLGGISSAIYYFGTGQFQSNFVQIGMLNALLKLVVVTFLFSIIYLFIFELLKRFTEKVSEPVFDIIENVVPDIDVPEKNEQLTYALICAAIAIDNNNVKLARQNIRSARSILNTIISQSEGPFSFYAKDKLESLESLAEVLNKLNLGMKSDYDFPKARKVLIHISNELFSNSLDFNKSLLDSYAQIVPSVREEKLKTQILRSWNSLPKLVRVPVVFSLLGVFGFILAVYAPVYLEVYTPDYLGKSALSTVITLLYLGIIALNKDSIIHI